VQIPSATTNERAQQVKIVIIFDFTEDQSLPVKHSVLHS